MASLVLAACREGDERIEFVSGPSDGGDAASDGGDGTGDDDDTSDGEGDVDGDDDASDGDATGDDDASDDDTTGEPPQWDSLAERECPDDSQLTWENFGGPFVLTYCTGCHHGGLPEGMRQDAPLDVNLESVALVRERADRVWARAADQNATMPPAGAPAMDERALLGEWLACGAPTNEDLGLVE